MKRNLLGLKMLLCALVLVMTIGIVNVLKADEEMLLKEALDAIKGEYGAFYIPSKTIDPIALENVYGVDLGLVESFEGECAYMSTHVDVFLGIKVKRGQANRVENQLLAYREALLIKFEGDAAKHAKIEASKVHIYGDLVFFMVLGQNSDTLSSNEQAFLEKAEDEIKRGERILEKVIRK